ncbi:hypothetical protein CRE_24785 [Caenorhabditis remanei]|uniref:F-box domain-containing protein n=1 Tax=Caenorhabditis remanei TaxID=31234 RepID=E3NCS9_CAERE|nr:hypothetical protein CRE_24785 [Caenorhabditis remanei]
MTTSSFPLLNLPLEVITHVLKSMDYGEFITLSFLSKRAKKSVESMNLRQHKYYATISDYVTICMSVGTEDLEWNFKLGHDSTNQTDFSLSSLDNVELENGERKLWSMERLSITEWMSHFKKIFNCSILNYLYFDENSSIFDIDDIRRTFENVFYKLVIYTEAGSVAFRNDILKRLPTKSLELENIVFDTLYDPHRILIQNYDQLQIQSSMNFPSNVTLDDLLIVNSKMITHWIKGSNPRMEMFNFSKSLRRPLNKSIILRGIRHMELPVDQINIFKQINGFSDTMTGGTEFYRMDGTKATINLYYGEQYEITSLYMYCTLHFLDSSTKFDINELRNTFDSSWTLWIEDNRDDSTNNFDSLINSLPTRSLILDDGVLPLNRPHQVLIHNYDKLEIDPLFPTPFTLELDDLLIVNSKYTKVTDLNWTVKDFNRFIKHWIKGSNPRMEMLTIDFHTLHEPEIPSFLKGIRHTEVAEDETRWFKHHHNGKIIGVDGGFDFYRQDGTKATIAYILDKYDEDDDDEYGINWIAMFVWHPHCDFDY